MQQIVRTWTALNMRKQIIVVVATVAMFAAVVILARIAAKPSMSLLYAGLESGQAGEVVGALEQRGVAYDVRGGSIFVPTASRDELRLTLASEGLPANNAQGYELLDTLTGFGTTSQMFDAAYWRAKEGELARTILANPQIRAARVHIANTTSNPFQRDLRTSASVAVGTAGAGLSAEQARALRFLVSSAVAGLDPSDVAVIDSNGGLVASSDAATPVTAGEDRAQKIREQVIRLLEARVGHGNAVVEVNVETVTESESIRERVVDPESRVAISTDTEERSNSANDAGGGVTVASNLPEGDGAGGESSSQNSETRERANYEVSETEREILRVPGAIKRLSVAVMVNDSALAPDGAAADAAPEVLAEAAEAELAALRELVSSAVGFDETRGDILTLKSMAFTPLGTEGTPAAAPGMLSGLTLDPMTLIQMAVASVVALVLGLFVVRPIPTRPAMAALPLPEGPADDMTAGDMAVGEAPRLPDAALTGEIDDGTGDFAPLVPARAEPEEVPSDDPVERLRHLINERQDETVEVLRGWLDEKQENA